MTTWADIQRGIFAGESGGDYGALYGFANRPGKMFSDVDVRNMTINEVLDFQNPQGPYAQYVGGLNRGVVSSPAGAYQIVGRTLRDARDRMGLTGGERFTPEMQDRIGRWIYDQQGTGAWEGYQGPQGGNMAYTDQPTPTQAGLLANIEPTQRDRRRDLAGRAAMAFNTLRQRPDASIPAMVEARRGDRQANRTAQWLAQQPGGEVFANMIAAGASGAQALQAYQASLAKSPTKGVAVGNRLVNPITGEVIYEDTSPPTKGVAVDDRLVNPITGEVIYEDTAQPGYDEKDVASARKEFTALPQVKNFAEQTAAYGRILASIDRAPGQKSGAADISLIFNYMKVLDPTSTVREGEFAAAAKAGGFGSQIQGLVSQIESGEFLTPSQRADFADRSTRLYAQAEEQYQSVADQYGRFADAVGLPVEQVIPDFTYSGEKYKTPLKFRRPTTPNGITEDDWKSAWENMTDDERRQYLGE